MKLPSLLALTVTVALVLASSHAIASNDNIINVNAKSNKAFDATRAEARHPFERDITVKKTSASAWATFIARRDAASAAANKDQDAPATSASQHAGRAVNMVLERDNGDNGHDHDRDHPHNGTHHNAVSLTDAPVMSRHTQKDEPDQHNPPGKGSNAVVAVKRAGDDAGHHANKGGHGGSAGGGALQQVDEEKDVADTLEKRDDEGGSTGHDGRRTNTDRLTSKRNTDSGMVKQVDELVLRLEAP